MGCDIHLYTEVKKTVNNTKRWFNSDNYTKNRYFDGVDKWEKEYEVNEIYGDRCYDLFSVLADVRNGYGFAGCETGEGFKPISKPKGIPEDTCKEIKAENEEWGGDGHSHSYLTLKELKEYDLDQCTFKVGVVGLDEFLEYEKTGINPTSFCGWTAGNDIIVIQPDEVKSLKKIDGKKYSVQMRWPVTYRERVEHGYNQILEGLERIKSHRRHGVESEEDIRIVFWFDN